MSASSGGTERTERSRSIEGATAVYFNETIKRHLHKKYSHIIIKNRGSIRKVIAFILDKHMLRLRTAKINRLK